MTPEYLWAFLPLGYLLAVLIEAPILFAGLGRSYPWQTRLFAGWWLTACTYPIVVLVLPLCLAAGDNRPAYLLVAETFAPLAECLIFAAVLGDPKTRWRDWSVIIAANLASFGGGELAYWLAAVS